MRTLAVLALAALLIALAFAGSSRAGLSRAFQPAATSWQIDRP